MMMESVRLPIMTNKIVISKAKNGQTFITLKGGNNKKLVHSETYKSHRGAENAANNLKKVIPNAKIIDKAK
jgi:uncharacterized protein YegP (UPF0339 family)